MSKNFEKKKTTFHKLEFLDKESGSFFEHFPFEDFLNWLKDLDESDRLKPVQTDKTTSLDFKEKITDERVRPYVGSWFSGFSTSRYGTKKDLKNALTGAKRDNPKDINEGEDIYNYFIILEKRPGRFEIIFQEDRDGILPEFVGEYLEKFIKLYLLEFGGEEIPFDLKHSVGMASVEQMMARIDRVTSAKVRFEKEILTDELGLLETSTNIKRYLDIKMTAEDRGSMKEEAKSLLSSANDKIHNIYIEGKDFSKGDVRFWANDVQKHITLKIEIHPLTKALKRANVKMKMMTLID